PGVAAHRVARTTRDRGHRLAPVAGQLTVRDDDLAQQLVEHQREQLVLRADVVVQRHRPDLELGRDAAHRHRVDALRVGNAYRGRRELRATEARLARTRFGARPEVERVELRGDAS